MACNDGRWEEKSPTSIKDEIKNKSMRLSSVMEGLGMNKERTRLKMEIGNSIWWAGEPTSQEESIYLFLDLLIRSMLPPTTPSDCLPATYNLWLKLSSSSCSSFWNRCEKCFKNELFSFYWKNISQHHRLFLLRFIESTFPWYRERNCWRWRMMGSPGCLNLSLHSPNKQQQNNTTIAA